MNEQAHLLESVFIFLVTICVMVPIINRFKLGSVLGYLLAGIVIGPSVLRLIGGAEDIMHLAEFGVVMLLFVIGLELEVKRLWQMRHNILGLGAAQVVCTSLIFTGVGWLCGFSVSTSIAVGMALSLSSTALVIQILSEKNLLHTRGGEAAFSVLLFQDIAVIGMLLILPLLVQDAGDPPKHWLSDLSAIAQVGIVGIIIGLVIVFGRYAAPRVFKYMAKTNVREVFTATSLALVIGVTLLMKNIGISPAMGAFIAGLVLASSPYKRNLETDIEPFKGLLLGLFFVSVGMSMNFDVLTEKLWWVMAILAALVVGKFFIIFMLGAIGRLESRQNLGLALSLAQGGEFAFVLLQYSQQMDIIDKSMRDALTLAIALSMLCTPLLLELYSRIIARSFMSVLPKRQADPVYDQGHRILMAGFGRFGQIVSRFLTAQGIPSTVLEKDPEQIELLRKFGYSAFYGDASRLDLLRAAGAENATIFILAIGNAEKSVEIAKMVRVEFPHLRIFARARNRDHAYALNKAGVAYFRRETFDSALTLAGEVIHVLGKSKPEIDYRKRQFTEHDEQMLKESFAFFEHQPELIKFAKKSREELEQILQQDMEEERGEALGIRH
jgi:glutathione-regulated potassium-efflux system ancillary protein KefC